MRRAIRGRLVTILIGLTVFGVTGVVWGDQPPGGRAPAADPKNGDQRLSDSLKDVINRGADLYNTGDPNGCYRLFQGALMVARAQLDHRPDLQKAIDAGVENAGRMGSVPARAFGLYDVLGDIRAKLKPKKAVETKPADKKPMEVKPADKKPMEVKPAPSITLWERLGGETTVKKVVDDFVARAANDPKVNFDRGGKIKIDDQGVVRLKKALVGFISQATGGPLKYSGKSMKDVHRGMGITDGEFDALAAHLKIALEKNGAKPADIALVLGAVEGTRKDIVELKKPEEKKPVDKKPDVKLPIKPADDKKPEAKDDGGTGDVNGKITYKGTPLGGGTIQFVPEGNVADKGYSATINKDGTFTVKAVKTGTYIITVKGNEAAIPAAFADPMRSGVRSTVVPGTSVHQIQIQ